MDSLQWRWCIRLLHTFFHSAVSSSTLRAYIHSIRATLITLSPYLLLRIVFSAFSLSSFSSALLLIPIYLVGFTFLFVSTSRDSPYWCWRRHWIIPLVLSSILFFKDVIFYTWPESVPPEDLPLLQDPLVTFLTLRLAFYPYVYSLSSETPTPLFYGIERDTLAGCLALTIGILHSYLVLTSESPIAWPFLFPLLILLVTVVSRRLAWSEVVLFRKNMARFIYRDVIVSPLPFSSSYSYSFIMGDRLSLYGRSTPPMPLGIVGEKRQWIDVVVESHPALLSNLSSIIVDYVWYKRYTPFPTHLSTLLSPTTFAIVPAATVAYGVSFSELHRPVEGHLLHFDGVPLCILLYVRPALSSTTILYSSMSGCTPPFCYEVDTGPYSDLLSSLEWLSDILPSNMLCKIDRSPPLERRKKKEEEKTRPMVLGFGFTPPPQPPQHLTSTSKLLSTDPSRAKKKKKKLEKVGDSVWVLGFTKDHLDLSSSPLPPPTDRPFCIVLDVSRHLWPEQYYLNGDLRCLLQCSPRITWTEVHRV